MGDMGYDHRAVLWAWRPPCCREEGGAAQLAAESSPGDDHSGTAEELQGCDGSGCGETPSHIQPLLCGASAPAARTTRPPLHQPAAAIQCFVLPRINVTAEGGGAVTEAPADGQAT
jgi:hypothetical protein